MPFANNFVVGCDPEFAVVEKASGAVVVPDTVRSSPKFVGLDGGGWLAELRPTPSRSTWTVLRRLRWAMDHTKLMKYLGHKWRAGAWFTSKRLCSCSTCRRRVEEGLGHYHEPDSYDFPMGGHIHLDVLPPQGGSYATDGFYVESLPEDPRITALDTITRYYEALDILPADEASTRREDGDYGRFGDYRNNDAGGKNHMEYRTMPSWLYHPVASYLCLTGAKLAVVDPTLCLNTLNPETASLPKLKGWFEEFKTKDDDARRIVDDCLAGKSKLSFDPDVDFKETWQGVPSLREKENEPQQQAVTEQPTATPAPATSALPPAFNTAAIHSINFDPTNLQYRIRVGNRDHTVSAQAMQNVQANLQAGQLQSVSAQAEEYVTQRLLASMADQLGLAAARAADERL